MLEHDAPVSRHVAIMAASLEAEGSPRPRMPRGVADGGITDVCIPGGLCRPRPSNEAGAVGNISRILVECSIHEGGLVGDAAMLKKTYREADLVRSMGVAVGRRPDKGERNAC
jgi:hypothetical protein